MKIEVIARCNRCVEKGLSQSLPIVIDVSDMTLGAEYKGYILLPKQNILQQHRKEKHEDRFPDIEVGRIGNHSLFTMYQGENEVGKLYLTADQPEAEHLCYLNEKTRLGLYPSVERNLRYRAHRIKSTVEGFLHRRER